MARISYADQALSDLERISDFLSANGLNELETLDLIDEAVSILDGIARQGLVAFRKRWRVIRARRL